MNPSFRTDMSGQTVQTQIRLLLEEQSDQGLHYLPFDLHRFGRITLWKINISQILGLLHYIFRVSEFLGVLRLVYGKTRLFKFNSNFSSVRIFLISTVPRFSLLFQYNGQTLLRVQLIT